MPASNQEWKTRDGQVIPIADMEDSHLINSMLYLHRRRDEGSDHKKAWSWQRIVTLAEEMQRRRLLPDPLSESDLMRWLDTRMAEQDLARQQRWRTPYHRGTRPPTQAISRRAHTPDAGLREAPVVSPTGQPAPLARKLDLSDW